MKKNDKEKNYINDCPLPDPSTAEKNPYGYRAHCPECNWTSLNCFMNVSTGTASKNACQEADTHNKTTRHETNNIARVEFCYER